MHKNCLHALALFSLLALANACHRPNNTVSGTIEVDEVHVGPRMGGRVGKIFAQEGDKLTPGQTIVELDAAELTARRELAAAQINSATHDTEAQGAQLVFMRGDAVRQQDLLKRHVVSPSDAERAASIAVREVQAFLRDDAPIDKVLLVCFSAEAREVYSRALAEMV